MWQHKTTAERLDAIESWFARLFGDARHDNSDPVLRFLIHMEKRLMSALSDKLTVAVDQLAAQIAAIGDSLVANDEAIQAEIAALTAAVQNNDTAAIDTAIVKIGELSASAAAQVADIKGDTERLTASLPKA